MLAVCINHSKHRFKTLVHVAINMHGVALILFLTLSIGLPSIDCAYEEFEFCPGAECRSWVGLSSEVLRMEQNMNENNKEPFFASLKTSADDFGSYDDSFCDFCSEGSTSISKQDFDEYKKWWENEAASIYRNISGILVDIGVFRCILSICFLIPK